AREFVSTTPRVGFAVSVLNQKTCEVLGTLKVSSHQHEQAFSSYQRLAESRPHVRFHRTHTPAHRQSVWRCRTRRRQNPRSQTPFPRNRFYRTHVFSGTTHRTR